MKCSMLPHFIRVCTICLDKIDLHRKKYNICLEIIICDPSIYIMGHPDQTVSNFIEYSIGPKRVKTATTFSDGGIY